jgi:hypothetical protein
MLALYFSTCKVGIGRRAFYRVSAQSGLTWSGRDCRAWTRCPRGAPAVQCSAVQRSMAYRTPTWPLQQLWRLLQCRPRHRLLEAENAPRPVPCGEGCREAAEGQSSYPLSQGTNAQTLDGKPIYKDRIHLLTGRPPGACSMAIGYQPSH